MKCKIISISHKLSNWEQQALQFYSKQLPSNYKISYAEAKPTSSKNLDKESILEAERIELVKYIESDSHRPWMCRRWSTTVEENQNPIY